MVIPIYRYFSLCPWAQNIANHLGMCISIPFGSKCNCRHINLLIYLVLFRPFSNYTWMPWSRYWTGWRWRPARPEAFAYSWIFPLGEVGLPGLLADACQIGGGVTPAAWWAASLMSLMRWLVSWNARTCPLIPLLAWGELVILMPRDNVKECPPHLAPSPPTYVFILLSRGRETSWFLVY